MTLPLINMRASAMVQAPVWLPVAIEGEYRGPIPRTYPARWLTGADMDPNIYRESQASNAVVRLDIDQSGKLTACNLALESASQRYNALVLRVFCKRARFLPATLNGEAVASTILIPLLYFNPDR
jgi:hypothetical protein